MKGAASSVDNKGGFGKLCKGDQDGGACVLILGRHYNNEVIAGSEIFCTISAHQNSVVK